MTYSVAIVWLLSMALVSIAFVLLARRSRRIDQATEQVAKKNLPELGRVAEQQHQKRFGRASTQPGAWYPEKKSLLARAKNT